MDKVFQRAFLVLLVCLLSGGHWAVLQGIAWTGMIVDYSREATLWDGVRKTFDGQNPCNMCMAINRGMQEEAARNSEAPAPRVDDVRLFGLQPTSTRVLRPAPRALDYEVVGHPPLEAPGGKPPVPPPRFV